MNRIIFLLFLLCFPVSGALAGPSAELDNLLRSVEALGITRGEYTLGKKLTKNQKETAASGAIEISTPGAFKFKDGHMFVVAEETLDRVIIMYEHYEKASSSHMRDLVGSLYLDFGDPTVLVHDKIIYWAFSPTGKLSKEAYNTGKKEEGSLNILATVKLVSSRNILGHPDENDDGSVYYTISSDPVLEFIKTRPND